MPIPKLCYYHTHDILDRVYRNKKEAIIKEARMINVKSDRRQHLELDIQIIYESSGFGFYTAEFKGGTAGVLMEDFGVGSLRELSGKKLFAHLDRYEKIMGFSAYLNK